MQILKAILFWVGLAICVPIGMTFIGLPEKMAIYAGTGILFSAIAHLSQSPYWKHLKHKELNPFSKNYGESSVPMPPPLAAKPSMMSRLDSPSKRLWFLIMLFGIAVLAITLVTCRINHPDDNTLEYLFDWDSYLLAYKLFSLIGVVISVCGYLGAFQYERTVGRLIAWVRG